MNLPPTTLQRQVAQLVRQGNWPAAAHACAQLNQEYPRYAPGWRAGSEVALALGRAGDALQYIERALAIEPRDAHCLMQRAQCLVALDRRVEAAGVAAAARRLAPSNAPLLDAIGTALSRANDHTGALEAYDRALALAPQDARLLFNRAAVRRYVGALAEAEADYDRVIALNPRDYAAYKNRSDLRTQTAENNHVEELRTLLATGDLPWQGEVQLQYALAKEYEDLGRYEESFRHVQRGAALRRQHLRYDIGTDEATVDWIIEAFPHGSVTVGGDASMEAPIFIVGLPRSGTTLVDRILGSHSTLRSAGELNSFASSVVAGVSARSQGARPARRELVAGSARLDFGLLGRDYLARARAAGASEGRFIDKMPLNYLYCGLIARALPNARIVHVYRHPLAACHAVHKTLFQDAYPFAYDLAELGRYYVAYRRLMAHWEGALPGRIHSLQYEELVADQPGQTRKLLSYCGLEWQEACARFERNPAPVTTASAAQVRRPLYRSSVSLWQRYRQQLCGLAQQLRDAGIPLGEPPRSIDADDR